MKKYILLLIVVSGGAYATGNFGISHVSSLFSSWNHRDKDGKTPDKVLTSTLNLINYSGVREKNRLVTSNVIPVYIEGESNPYSLLEDFQMHHMETSRRRNGKSHMFSKVFNFDDVSRWEMHNPELYVETIEGHSPKTFTTDYEAAGYFCKNTDIENGTIYYDPSQTGSDCAPDRQLAKNGSTTTLLELSESHGLEIGADMHALAYTKSGFVKSARDGKLHIEVDTNGFKEKPVITFDLINGIVEFDERFIKRTNTGERFLRISIPTADGSRPRYYIPVLKEEEMEY